jgi:hypothetical protein
MVQLNAYLTGYCACYGAENATLLQAALAHSVAPSVAAAVALLKATSLLWFNPSRGIEQFRWCKTVTSVSGQ